MKKSLITICYLALTQITIAQNYKWAKAFSSSFENEGFSIVSDANGNVYTTGYFNGTVDFDPNPTTYTLTSNGGKDVFISKLDSLGNFVWAFQIGTTNFEESKAIAIDASNNIVITGNYLDATCDFDPSASTFTIGSGFSGGQFIAKYTPAGNFIWAKGIYGSFTTSTTRALLIDNSNNILTTGAFMGTVDFDPSATNYTLTSTANDIYISKLDPSGNFIWAKQMKGPNDDRGLSICTNINGDIFTTGVFQDSVDFDPSTSVFRLKSKGGFDVFISKLNSAGNFVWAKCVGSVNNDWGNTCKADGIGNIYVFGDYNGTVDFDPNAGLANLTPLSGEERFILKLSDQGDFKWVKRSPGIGNDNAGCSKIAVDYFGNVYTTSDYSGTKNFDPNTGSTLLTAIGSPDMYLTKIDSLGNLLWAKSFGGIGGAVYPLAVSISNSGSIYATGYFFKTVDFDPSTGIAAVSAPDNYNTFVLRLAQVAIYPPTLINEIVFSESSVSIYPNPTDGIINVELSMITEELSRISISNILGEEVLKMTKTSNKFTLNANNLTGGVYFISINCDGKTVTKKIIINN